jgi:hypothetical protein
MSMDAGFEYALDALDARLVAAKPIALGRGMEHVRTVAADLTPVLSGQLVGSAGVTVADDEAHLTYPGPYARYQHYGLDFRHTKGQALYLEQPMITEVSKVITIVAETLGSAF